MQLLSGELYVENLGERRIVSIRMGWLWVEGTQMRLPLRALNLRQAPPSIRQPHILSLGFSLSNSQNVVLATFWVILILCNTHILRVYQYYWIPESRMINFIAFHFQFYKIKITKYKIYNLYNIMTINVNAFIVKTKKHPFYLKLQLNLKVVDDEKC